MATFVPLPILFHVVVDVEQEPNADPLFLIVEGGTGTPRANSYASLAYANNYFIGKRLFSSAWVASTDDVKTIALKEATFVLDAEFAWTGEGTHTKTQGLQWPRRKAYDRDGRHVTGVPKRVRDATCELAMYLLAQDRLVGREGVGIHSLKVDVIQIVYDKTDAPETFPPHVARMLIGYGSPMRGAQVRNVKLYRV